MAKCCRLTIPRREPKKNINSHKQEPPRIWRRKQDQFNTEEHLLDLQDEHKKVMMFGEHGEDILPD
jgi:hypothetical protein